MASISQNGGGNLFRIKSFLGLNQSDDGEADLKAGEAAVMRNFRVTREGNLQIRPGYAPRHKLGEGEVRALWSGFVGGEQVLLALCGGSLWRAEGEEAVLCGSVGEDSPGHIFGFGGKAYLLTGGEYYVWDGAALAPVEGYIPLVSVAAPPEGGGTLLEGVNRLTGKRRQRFSPDGTATLFTLAEDHLTAVLAVERSDGGEVPDWTADPEKGTVTFDSAPAVGTDCLTVTYDTGTDDRKTVADMAFAEVYGGVTDSRVFLSGDGSNIALYSEPDGNGLPSAEYFPSLNLITAGEANTPITGLIRHFSRLIVFKRDGAFSVSASTMTLADGMAAAAFHVTPIQRDVGCAAPGQVCLVYNDPRTVWGGAVWRWSGNSGSLNDDERTVSRLSQRVEATLKGWAVEDCTVFDDEMEMEWYLFHKESALVHNYERDVWYQYTDLPVSHMVRHGGELLFGTPTGEIMRFSREFRADNGAPIEAYWESGSMAFSRDRELKNLSDLWVSLKPEERGQVTVTLRTDRRGGYPGRTVTSAVASSFRHVNFAHFSFATSRAPQVKRVHIRLKKFAYASLIFSSASAESTVTLLGADLRFRTGGTVRRQ